MDLTGVDADHDDVVGDGDEGAEEKSEDEAVGEDAAEREDDSADEVEDEDFKPDEDNAPSRGRAFSAPGSGDADSLRTDDFSPATKESSRSWAGLGRSCMVSSLIASSNILYLF